jgi:hypothetical protein
MSDTLQASTPTDEMPAPTLAAQLRAAADFLDQAGDLGTLSGNVEIAFQPNLWSRDDDGRAAELARIARAMSPCEKEYSASLLQIRHHVGPDVMVEVFTSRSDACERRVVGTRTVERQVVVQPAVTRTETVEEEVVEWDCKPLLLTPDEQAHGLAGVTQARQALNGGEGADA